MDPVLLFAGKDAITEGIKDCVQKAGPKVCVLLEAERAWPCV